MKDKAFIDTNIFVYLYSSDETTKQKQAFAVFERYECLTSMQVLHEFSNVCVKKLKMPVENIKLALDELLNAFAAVSVDDEIIKYALDLHKKYGFSYYDCVMLASALAHGCKYFISEDLTDKQVIENQLTIKNIFV
ncbi:DNA-binding protein [Candidatus Termititenax aidoneus]|uniref:DNA-binding protein n=1 Tax=Termititenax aidoneus TaxID=2218524 RepID=A0A388TB81_TERA1|nr:DNA-binding protein [Candidatus Termititenax aidoneus]